MRNLVMILAFCGLFMSFLGAEENLEKTAAEKSMEKIHEHINRCRKIVSNNANANLDVLKQYDSFTQVLKKAWFAGEGFIEKDIHRILKGVAFAAKKHSFQMRKNPSKQPYIIHPIGVAELLMTTGNVRDRDVIIAGLLHDTVEDTNTTFEEIKHSFGCRVSRMVREVTDDKSLTKEARKQAQVDHAHEKSAAAAQVKLADKLYNLTDLSKTPPTGWSQERIDQYFDWAKAVVDNLPWVNAPLKKAVDEVIQAKNSGK